MHAISECLNVYVPLMMGSLTVKPMMGSSPPNTLDVLYISDTVMEEDTQVCVTLDGQLGE